MLVAPPQEYDAICTYWELALANEMPVPEHVGLLRGVAASEEYVSTTAAPVVQPRKSHSCTWLHCDDADEA